MSRDMPASIVVIEHEADCPLGRFADWLDGIAVRVVRPYVGDPVPGSVEHGLIVLGGHMSAYDDDLAPWLPAVRDLLSDSVARQVPTLGICLGAQLLAVAREGLVEVAAAPGREAGVIDLTWLPEASTDVLTAGLPDPAASASMHADAVVKLPPDAVWLASSAMYPYQAFRVGTAAWGLQFHPEVAPTTFRGWARLYPDIDESTASADLAARNGEMVMLGQSLAQRFSSLVR